MFYAKEELSSLPRKELQKLCKQFSIKANKKNCELVDDLVQYFDELEKEEQSLEKEIKSWVSDDEEEQPSVSKDDEEEQPSASKDDVSEVNENCEKEADTLKQELEIELERRAEEKLTKIPRFRCDKVNNLQAADLMSPITQKLSKSHKRQFDKMDSIDVYLHKKKQRVEERLTYHSKLKTQAERSLKNMKMSHNTPAGANAQVNNTGQKCSGSTPNRDRRKSFYKSPFKPTLKIDKEVTFNFVSKLKSPKIISKSTLVLKEQHTNKSTARLTRSSAAKDARKSVQFVSVEKQKNVVKTNCLNATAGDKSPRFLCVGTDTSVTKTPLKFDLQASLKKRLSYKPHKGKLKDSYMRKSTEPLNTTMNSTFTIQQKSVKEIAKPKATRNDRRKATTKRRGNKRDEVLTKRRGIIA